MIPESCYGLLCDLRVLEAISIKVENRKLLSTHDIRCRLCLDPTPDIPDSSLKDGGDGWVYLALFIVSDDL